MTSLSALLHGFDHSRNGEQLAEKGSFVSQFQFRRAEQFLAREILRDEQVTDAKIFFERACKPGANQTGKVFPAQQYFQALAAGVTANPRVNDGQIFAVKLPAKSLHAFARILYRVLKPADEIGAFRGQGKSNRNH